MRPLIGRSINHIFLRCDVLLVRPIISVCSQVCIQLPYTTMAANSTIPPEAILNPYTPLAFLPPDVADRYQVMLYVYVANLAVSYVRSEATINLTRRAYRLIRGIGSWQSRTSTPLSERWGSTRLISRISCRDP